MFLVRSQLPSRIVYIFDQFKVLFKDTKVKILLLVTFVIGDQCNSAISFNKGKYLDTRGSRSLVTVKGQRKICKMRLQYILAKGSRHS